MKAQGVRCGVVGVGSLGQHHARIYEALWQSQLVGIYDLDQRRAAEIAGKHNCRAFPSLEELGRACDAVSVVVPTKAHESTALPLLANGCHLLIEKPLCTSIEEAERVLAAANANDRLVQVGHIEHFNPVMSYLEKQANDPKYITTERLAPYSMRGTDVGVVLDLMIHDIGIVMALVKSPLRRIDSLGINVLSKTEDIANARLEFESGCVANLKIGLAKPGDASAIPVHPIPIEKGEPLAIELAHFVDSVARAREPKVGGELGRSALEVAIRITEQIRSGKR